MPINSTPFALDPQLAADTLFVCDLDLSRVLLMDDTRFPWLILVPRRTGMRDWIDLPVVEQHALQDEIALCAGVLRRAAAPDKLNIASLGNIVAQLHVHVIARFRSDAAWPKPVWGVGERLGYPTDAAAAHVARLRADLAQ